MATSNHSESTTPPFEDRGGAERDRSVREAYEGMRRLLVERLDLAAETHWEVLEAVEAAGLEDEALAALRRLTEIYERAVFAPGAVPVEEATWAVAVATRFEELTGKTSSG